MLIFLFYRVIKRSWCGFAVREDLFTTRHTHTMTSFGAVSRRPLAESFTDSSSSGLYLVREEEEESSLDDALGRLHRFGPAAAAARGQLSRRGPGGGSRRGARRPAGVEFFRALPKCQADPAPAAGRLESARGHAGRRCWRRAPWQWPTSWRSRAVRLDAASEGLAETQKDGHVWVECTADGRRVARWDCGSGSSVEYLWGAGGGAARRTGQLQNPRRTDTTPSGEFLLFQTLSSPTSMRSNSTVKASSCPGEVQWKSFNILARSSAQWGLTDWKEKKIPATQFLNRFHFVVFSFENIPVSFDFLLRKSYSWNIRQPSTALDIRLSPCENPRIPVYCPNSVYTRTV